MDCQKIIEAFFSMLGRFDFDRAKTYIDGRKEVLQKLAPTFPNQVQLMAMLSTFSHLAEVEKNYHNQPYSNQKEHSFLATTNFLRKTKSLKDMYSEIFSELKQLDVIDMSHNTNKPGTATKQQQQNITLIPEHRLDNETSMINSSTSSFTIGNGVLISPGNRNTTKSRQQSMSGGVDQQSSNSSSTDKDSPNVQVPQSPVSAFRNNFLRVLSPVSSTSVNLLSSPASSAGITNNVNDHYSTSSTSGYEPPPNSSTTTPILSVNQIKEFSGELISHFCRQLQKFIQARLDLVEVYEKLIDASTKKYPSLDGISFRLSTLCRQYHKYFHHPLLAPIKEGMTLECESLMTLIRATVDMQHWRFMETLFDLQEAQSKLNFWASNTFNKEASRRRFKVSKTQTAPRLFEWLCRYKDFLISKFTLYFHSTLTRSLPTSNMKSCCSKLSVDYHSKFLSFQRKIDALFIALMFDVSNDRDFRGLGYNYPSRHYVQPQGKNTLQPMVVIPSDGRNTLNTLQAELYMIVVTNQQTMVKDGYYQFHDTTKRLTYSISRLDSNVVLTIVCEGQKTDRDSIVRNFSHEIANQFAFSNIFLNQ